MVFFPQIQDFLEGLPGWAGVAGDAILHLLRPIAVLSDFLRNIREEWEELKKLARDMTSWWDNVPGVVKAGIEGIAPGLGGAIESTAAFGRESDDRTLASPAIISDADTDTGGGGGLLGGIGGMFANLLSTLGIGEGGHDARHKHNHTGSHWPHHTGRLSHAHSPAR